MRYVDWVLPGILGMNMMFSCLFGVGYVVVRYRKNGFLKRLRATPLRAIRVDGSTWRRWRMAAAVHDLPLTTWLHRVADAAAAQSLRDVPEPTANVSGEGGVSWSGG